VCPSQPPRWRPSFGSPCYPVKFSEWLHHIPLSQAKYCHLFEILVFTPLRSFPSILYQVLAVLLEGHESVSLLQLVYIGHCCPSTVRGAICQVTRAHKQSSRRRRSGRDWGFPPTASTNLAGPFLWLNHLRSESSSPVIPACDHRPHWHVISVSRKNLIQNCLVNPLSNSWSIGTTGYENKVYCSMH